MLNIGALLKRIWLKEIEPLYNSGLINGKENLISYIFLSLSKELPHETCLWCYPRLHIALKDGRYSLWGIYRLRRKVMLYRPDLVITWKDKVVGLLSLRYSPNRYTDYRRDLKKLLPLVQLIGKGQLFLRIHPDTGEPDETYPYTIDPELTLIYAVISKSSGFALDIEALKNDIDYVSKNFLHLTASIDQNKVIFNSTLC